jgi:hypothetical protein
MHDGLKLWILWWQLKQIDMCKYVRILSVAKLYNLHRCYWCKLRNAELAEYDMYRIIRMQNSQNKLYRCMIEYHNNVLHTNWLLDITVNSILKTWYDLQINHENILSS